MTSKTISKILVIDSQRAVRRSLKDLLVLNNYDAITSESILDAKHILKRTRFDIILCEYNQRGDLERVVEDSIPVVFMLDEWQRPDDNIQDVIIKPINVSVLLEKIYNVLTLMKSQSYPINKRNGKHERQQFSGTLVGDGQKMSILKSLIGKVAPSDARVLIVGANGTGKELVARSIHMKSRRCDAPFVEVNCAAIPSELIESELFGHEKGSFTSAIKDKKGKFEQAQYGTIFLDEIGDMSLSAQAKVLRALQERKISRVGGERDIDVDVRVIAATNKDLIMEIDKGNFREDLYHRLSVIVIRVPTLNERTEDIPLLIDYFITTISAQYNIEAKEIDKRAVDFLTGRVWRGNIRELRNVIERLIVLSNDTITLSDVKQYVEVLS